MEVQYIVLHGNYTNDKLTITMPRRYVLNIYTCNNAYADIFQTDFG